MNKISIFALLVCICFCCGCGTNTNDATSEYDAGKYEANTSEEPGADQNTEFLAEQDVGNIEDSDAVDAFSEDAAGTSGANASDADAVPTDRMTAYDAGSAMDLPDEILDNISQSVGVQFCYADDDVTILFYTEDEESPATAWINGQRYPFSYGMGYSPENGDEPYVCIYDINGDGFDDILIYGHSYRVELREDLYLARGDGTYVEQGDITWNQATKSMQGQGFSFAASYEDGGKIHVEASEWGIDETVSVGDDLFNLLVTLGVYNADGNLTDYGNSSVWSLDQLQGQDIAIEIGDNGNVVLSYDAQIEASYSEYCTGYGFSFQYSVVDDSYELDQVSFSMY